MLKNFQLLAAFAVSTVIHYMLLAGLFLIYELLTHYATFQISKFRGEFLKYNAVALAGAMLILFALLLLRKNQLSQIFIRDIPPVLSLINLTSLLNIFTSSIFIDQNIPLTIHLFILVALVAYFSLSIHKGFSFFKEKSLMYLKGKSMDLPIIDIREVIYQNRKNRLWVSAIITLTILIPLISRKTYSLNQDYLFLLLYLVTLIIVAVELSWLSTSLLTFLVHRQFSSEDRLRLNFDRKYSS